MKRWRSWALRFGFAAVFFPAAAQGAELRLAIAPEWAGQPIAIPSGTKANAAGQQIRVTRLSALFSDFILRRADGSAVNLPGRYGLIDAGNGRTELILGSVAEGDYAGLEFTIGLPPAADSGDASRWPAGHPLNPLTDGLHWGWQGGYVFVALEGNWREGTGPARGFSFHLASGAGAMRARLDVPFAMRGPTTLRCAWDLAGMLRPLRFKEDGTSSSTHSRSNDTLAPWLSAAVPRALGWRGFLETAATPERVAAKMILAAVTETVAAADPIPFIVPAGFPQPALPADNPLTRQGIALGRALFFDPRLSGTGRQSCASCHQPTHAYADAAPVSTGADGTRGARHSPSLLNLAWQPAFAWDGAKARIRDQALAALTSPREMRGDLKAVAAVISADPKTIALFRAAFGSAAPTAERIGLALEQYVLTLVSADSKFDRAARGEESLTVEEKRGMELFLTEYDPARGRHGADCFHCHGGALFGDFAYRDNGLGDANGDRGRGAVTGHPEDDGKFKTPSLRNVAVRGPYMHDGRFANLGAVVAHYATGVRRTPNLDPNLGKHPDAGMELSSTDQRALVEFLSTLTSTPD